MKNCFAFQANCHCHLEKNVCLHSATATATATPIAAKAATMERSIPRPPPATTTMRPLSEEPPPPPPQTWRGEGCCGTLLDSTRHLSSSSTGRQRGSSRLTLQRSQGYRDRGPLDADVIAADVAITVEVAVVAAVDLSVLVLVALATCSCCCSCCCCS